jgi:hypothetical protein
MAVVMPEPATVRSVPPGKHGKSLDPEQNEHVRKLLRDLLAGLPYKGSQTLLAGALGCSQAHVSNMVRAEEPVGIGFRLAQRAAMLAHISIEEALSGTRRSPTVVLELDERYHNRGLAAAGARAMGYPEAAIRSVQSVSLKSDADLTVDQWFDMIRAEKFRLERLAPREEGEPELTAEEREKATADLREQAERETRESEARSKAKRAKPPTPPSDPAA